MQPNIEKINVAKGAVTVEVPFSSALVTIYLSNANPVSVYDDEKPLMLCAPRTAQRVRFRTQGVRLILDGGDHEFLYQVAFGKWDRHEKADRRPPPEECRAHELSGAAAPAVHPATRHPARSVRRVRPRRGRL